MEWLADTLLSVSFTHHSIGSSSSHIDVAGDLLDTLWALHEISKAARWVRTSIYQSGHRERVRLIFSSIEDGIKEMLHKVNVLIADGEVDEPDYEKIGNIREDVNDFSDRLETIAPIDAELTDTYNMNLLLSYPETADEAPDFVRDEFRKFPERRFGFIRSALSARYQRSCFLSLSSWVMHKELNPDAYFRQTKQRYRYTQFRAAKVIFLGGDAIVISDDIMATFAQHECFMCKVVLTLVEGDDEPADFEPVHDFSLPREGRAYRHEMLDRSPFVRPIPACLLHPTGTSMIVNHHTHTQVFYGMRPFSYTEMKAVAERGSQVSDDLQRLLGIPAKAQLDWSRLTDDEFEHLCYDLIRVNPRFDETSLRKHGKSRSRDGGRDLEVREARTFRYQDTKKWIFQCKLIKTGKSLGTQQLLNLGDMLDQYNAHGFGVMTSTVIDSTLYDRMDAVCGRPHRKVDQQHFSVLELERELARYTKIKAKYFTD